MIDQVANPAAVRSLVGSSKLAELPALLAAASLFVGNNSGPHHLAAALEVPTVGIHSGAVDAPNGSGSDPRRLQSAATWDAAHAT